MQVLIEPLTLSSFWKLFCFTAKRYKKLKYEISKEQAVKNWTEKNGKGFCLCKMKKIKVSYSTKSRIKRNAKLKF